MLQVKCVAAVFLWYFCSINVYIEIIFLSLAKNMTFPEKSASFVITFSIVGQS